MKLPVSSCLPGLLLFHAFCTLCFFGISFVSADDPKSNRLDDLKKALLVRYGDKDKKGNVKASIPIFEKLTRGPLDGVSAHALYELGKIWLFGVDTFFGKKRNIRKAISLFYKSANMDHAGSQFYMSFFYSSDIQNILKGNVKKAAQYLKRSAELNYLPSILTIAFHFLYGIGCEKNVSAAILWYKRAFRLNEGYYDSFVFQQSLEEFKLTEKSIESHRSQTSQNSVVNNKQRKEALRYWEGRANGGDPLAKYELAKLRESEPNSEATVAELYRQASEENLAPALRDLGLCYLHNIGVPRNYDKAIHYLKRATELGDYEAASYLGYIYYTGEGNPEKGEAIPRNEALSIKYFKIAASKEVPEALYFLGELVAKNSARYSSSKAQKELERAFSLYRTAADYGLLQALWREGEMLEKGMGTSKNLSQAALNYKIIAEHPYSLEKMAEALKMYADRDYENCFLVNTIAAYTGLGPAQWNTGELLLARKGSNIFQNQYSKRIAKNNLSYCLIQGDITALKTLGKMALIEGKLQLAQELFHKGFKFGDLGCLAPLVDLFASKKETLDKAITLLEYKRYRNRIAKCQDGIAATIALWWDKLSVCGDIFLLKAKRHLLSLIGRR